MIGPCPRKCDMKKLLALLMMGLLVVPLAGCDVDDVLHGIDGVFDEIEDFLEDFDDGHRSGGITIIIGDDHDHDHDFWDWF